MRFLPAIVIVLAFAFAHAAEPPRPSPKPISIGKPWPPVSLPPILHPILRDSERIFSGTVLQVEHLNPSPSSALATTSIRFRVDEAIRGVRKGQIFEVKEWAGLWQSGEHYHAGQRVLLFLYPPSKLGLTSPVGHNAGRFPLDKYGRVLLKPPIGGLPQPIEMRKVVAAIRGAKQD